MRILRKMGFVLVVVAVVLAAAVSALGATAGARGKPPTTTTVPDQPMGGYTCAEYFGAEYDAMLVAHQVTFEEDTIRFTLSGKKDFVCLDVDSAHPGVWQVAAIGNNGTTKVGRFLLVPRDSYAPGDSCGGVDLRNVALPLAQELPHPDDPDHELIPASTVNACGTQFAEWIGGALVTQATGESHPLAFYAQMVAGSSGASATLTITLP